MLCWFLLYNQVNQPYVYTYPLPLGSPSLAPHPIPLGHHRALSWAPCAIQLAILHISSVQLVSHVWFFEIPWTAAHQSSLSTDNSWSLLKFMSTESGMPPNHPIPCCPLFFLPSIFHSIRVFFTNSVFTSGGQSIGTSTSVSVFPMNIQDWFPLELIGLISLQYKELSRIFYNTVEKHQFFSAQLSL